jgi:ABC-type Mn2+/Zn2+ transport system ATPase subunit
LKICSIVKSAPFPAGSNSAAFWPGRSPSRRTYFSLDEPFTGLDKPNQENLKQLLRTLRDQGKLLLVSHHDLATVPEIFDQVLLLNGELIAAGSVAEAFTDENIRKTYSTRVFSGPVHSHAHGHSHDHEHTH